MPDDPTPGELQRNFRLIREDLKSGFEEMNRRLDQMVTQGTFAAEMRRVEDRITDLTKDVADEKAARVEGDAAVRADFKDTITEIRLGLERTATWIRWVAASVLIPVALFVAGWVLRGQ